MPCADVDFNTVTLAVGRREDTGKCISREASWEAEAIIQMRYYSGSD